MHSCSGQFCLGQSSLLRIRGEKWQWSTQGHVGFFTTVVKVSLVLIDHVWKSDCQCFSWTCRFVFVKQLLCFLCPHCRPRVPLSREAVAVSEGCLHQLWRGTHGSPDKGKGADLGTLATVSPAWWFHSTFLGSHRRTDWLTVFLPTPVKDLIYSLIIYSEIHCQHDPLLVLRMKMLIIHSNE